MENRDRKINELIIRLIENQITDEEFQVLSAFMKEGPAAVAYYCGFIDDYVNTKSIIEAQMPQGLDKPENVLLDRDFWYTIAEHERTADPVENDHEPKDEDQPASPLVAPQVQQPKSKSKLSLYLTIISAAAMYMILFYLQMFPKPTIADVATLTDMIDATFVSNQYAIGDRLSPFNGHMKLTSGIVKINYDEHVQVTIEAPADFVIDSPTTIRLEYGRLYAHVGPSGKGFTVDTDNSRIIDLGTEFGVDAQHNGSTELHVIKGKTTVVAFDAHRHKEISDQTAGQAIEISGYNSKLDVRKIPVKETAFVRDICSETNVVWNGQNQFSLANVVGNGNGFYGGILGSGWNPKTGKYITNSRLHEWPKAENQYVPIQNNPFIDGVFVPDGGQGPVVLNSGNQSYDKFEDTTSVFRFNITNGPALSIRQRLRTPTIPYVDFYLQDLMLNGVAYGTSNKSAIYMHSNAGISFDLAAIRKSIPSDIVSFSTICGVPDQVYERIPGDSIAMLKAYIFLDDQCVFEKAFVSSDDASEDISIDILPKHRFLTLVITDIDQKSSYDWCLFGEPVLELSSK